ncbi:MAG: SDR family NAD(P)-dependent oxidoreductase [Alphaproteobacteria bacterium]|jgi:NAD(P)-dependent dehydrogenase (short-subunit alcohol dehydrogenase family)
MPIGPNEDTPGRNRLEGKVAIVTGAGSIGDGWGNGKAAAYVYAKEGAKTFCVDFRLEAAEQTVKQIEAIGGEAIAYAADVTDEAAVNAMVDACMEAWGRVDILHNNVGGQGVGRSLETITVEDWNATFARNVTSAMLTCKAVMPIMEKQKDGSIINISSIAALRHLNSNTAVYSSTKGAMIEFTKNIAIQHAVSGVRANCVCPGYIDTPFIRRLVNGKPSYTYKGYTSAEEYSAARDAIIPSGRMGTGFDVAYAALFLASDESTHITGTHVTVDGGVTQTCPGV